MHDRHCNCPPAGVVLTACRELGGALVRIKSMGDWSFVIERQEEVVEDQLVIEEGSGPRQTVPCPPRTRLRRFPQRAGPLPLCTPTSPASFVAGGRLDVGDRDCVMP